LLRLPEASDAAAFLEIHQHPEAIKYVVLAAPAGGISAAWRNVAMLLGHWQLRGYGQWAVVEKQTGEVIGRVGLWHPEGWPGVELGWIIRHSRWNQGFASEAAAASLEWAWTHTDVDHVISVIQPDNARAIRVAQKIGERFERTDFLNALDVHIYGIHRSDASPAAKTSSERA
jgi:RimJ/RimL family protein N-acetyltransferase